MKHSYKINFCSSSRKIEEKFESFNNYKPYDFHKEITKYFDGMGDFTASLYEDGKLKFVLTKNPEIKIEGLFKEEYGNCLYLHSEKPRPFYCVFGSRDVNIDYGELQPSLTEILDDLEYEFDPSEDFELRKYDSKDGSYKVIYRLSSNRIPIRQSERKKYPYMLELCLTPTMEDKIVVNGRESEYKDMKNALVEYWIETECGGHIYKDRYGIVDILSATREEEK